MPVKRCFFFTQPAWTHLFQNQDGYVLVKKLMQTLEADNLELKSINGQPVPELDLEGISTIKYSAPFVVEAGEKNILPAPTSALAFLRRAVCRRCANSWLRGNILCVVQLESAVAGRDSRLIKPLDHTATSQIHSSEHGQVIPCSSSCCS